jgi:hypothetical protein
MSVPVPKAKLDVQLSVGQLEELNAEAMKLADRLASNSDQIRTTRGKTFRMPGTELETPELTCIIVDYVNYFEFYKGKFKEDDPKPPVCVAASPTLSDMSPFEGVPEPQSDKCASCPRNVWIEGAGKECKNQMMLAVLPVNDQAGSRIMRLKISPTGLRFAAKHIATVTNAKDVPAPHPATVVSLLTFDPKPDYPSVRFSIAQPNPDYVAALSRRTEARQLLLQSPVRKS